MRSFLGLLQLLKYPLFLKNIFNPGAAWIVKAEAAGREAYARARVGAWLGITGNVFLSLIKFLAGILGHSSAMLADAIHSLSDVLSSVIVLAGFKVAQRLPDSEHPYGHSKAESVSAQIVSVFLVFLGGMVFLNSWRKVSLPDYVAPSSYVLVVALVSVVIKECLFRYKSCLGRRVHSSSLVADAWHHRSDALSSVAVMAGVLLAVAGGPRFRAADQIAAMAVALIICFTGLKMLQRTSSELMDQVLTGPSAERIKNLASGVEGVKAVEKLFVRKSGMELIADVHIEVGPHLSVVQGHDIAMKLKEELQKKIPLLNNVMVHVEPFIPESERRD